jgi:hypothetical protein
VVGDHEAEHAVAQELEPLIGPVAPGHPRGVGEREQAKLAREPVDQRPERLRSVGTVSCGW